MKKIVAIFLCVIITVTMTGHAMAADEKTVAGGLYSAEEYGDFSLSWTNNGNNDILLSATDESGTIFFQYDENDYRTVKVNSAGEATYFVYDSYKLMTVQFGTHQLAYTYDAYGELTGMIIDGTSYSCELEDGSVQKLIDGNGNTAVEYVYDGNRVITVYGRDEFGNLVDKTNDSEFIGNLNRVTYNSYYYDVETGWYYCGRYYDPANGRFVEGVSSHLQ